MTIQTRRRTAPVHAHAYTLPVVREIVIGTGASTDLPIRARSNQRRPMQPLSAPVPTGPAAVTLAEEALRRSEPPERVHSQRRLVAMSLLRCPDGSARD